MSKISLQPNASGTGTFTLAAPDSNTNRTLNLPDEAGTVATIENIPPGYEDQDALDLFNVTGSAPVFACRAWVNFDGTGTVSIRDSGNVSSITDLGTGQYRANFVTSMPDANYACVFGTRSGNTTNPNAAAFNGSLLLTTSVGFGTFEGSNVAQDYSIVTLAIFR